MQARLTTKPVQEVISAIRALDLETVKIRLMDPNVGEGWTREYANRIEVAYKTYLSMVAKYQEHAEDILLSKDVDEFWHTHILQTAKYTDDCEATFGKYLHHAPHIGEITKEDAAKREAQAEKTRRLYQSEFGTMENAETAWFGISLGAEHGQTAASAIEVEQAAVSAVYAGSRLVTQNAAVSAVYAKGGIATMNAAVSAAFAGKRIMPESAAVSAVFARGMIVSENAAVSAAFVGDGISAANAAVSAVFAGKRIAAEHAAVSAVFGGKRIVAENAAVSAVYAGNAGAAENAMALS